MYVLYRLIENVLIHTLKYMLLIFNSLLLSESGRIEFSEFQALMKEYKRRKRKAPPSAGEETLDYMSVDSFMWQTFCIFDKDKDGHINAADIQTSMADLGINLTEDDVKAMMQKANIGPHGKIYFRGMDRIVKHNNIKQHKFFLRVTVCKMYV